MKYIMNGISDKRDSLGIFEKFKVICKKCGSEDIQFEDSRGFSCESGSWGELKICCEECGEEEIVDDNIEDRYCYEN